MGGEKRGFVVNVTRYRTDRMSINCLTFPEQRGVNGNCETLIELRGWQATLTRWKNREG